MLRLIVMLGTLIQTGLNAPTDGYSTSWVHIVNFQTIINNMCRILYGKK
jgi:hypothetical protein